jgi:cell division protein FtsZ
MARRGIHGVGFIAANTDANALARSLAGKRIQLGTTGLGAGADPRTGRNAAIEARDRIADALKDAHMVFVVAGMGGGTGIGAAPVIAEIARSLGVLTLAVVITPFAFEGSIRHRLARTGIDDLDRQADSVMVFGNDKMSAVLGDGASMNDAFTAADNVLHDSVRAITDIITIPGLVGVDFEDVRAVLGNSGRSSIGVGIAAGSHRARIATEEALASPFLSAFDLPSASGFLVNITASRRMKMKEVTEVMNIARSVVADDSHIIFGATYDADMGEQMRVTILAAGRCFSKA